MGVNKLVPCSWYLRGPSDRNVSHDSTVAFCYSFSESTLCSALRLTEALYQRWNCTSKLNLLRTDLTDDAVLFKAFAALPVEGQPATAGTAPPLFLSNSPTVARNAQPLHSAVPWPARCFVADECGGMICKHCCVFWWWMFASCLHGVTHLSPQPLQDQLLRYHSW